MQTARLVRDPVGFLAALEREHGSTFTLRTSAWREVVVVSDPAVVQGLFEARPDEARAGDATGRVLPVLAPGCVLRLDGEEHLHRRRTLLPAFHRSALTSLAGRVASTAEETVAAWPADRPFRALGSVRSMAFAIAVDAVFGDRAPAVREDLERAVSRLLRWPLAVALLSPRSRVAARPRAAAARAQGALRARVSAEVAVRRTGRPDGDTDVLGLLLRDGVADEDVAAELTAMLLVGHETTASGMAWALELLARHPAVQARLRDELSAGDERYLEAVVREALRLRPPVIDVVRQLGMPAAVGTWRLPAGTVVMAVPALVHRRADVYPQPHAFCPERFLGARPKTYEWLPFGGGVRRCLGAPLAELEMKALLAQAVGTRSLAPATRRAERAALAGTALVPARGARISARITRTRPAARVPRARTPRGP